MPHKKTVVVLFVIVTLIATGILLTDPIAQDPGYHNFADARLLFGVPNFWNVVTSIALTATGFAGAHNIIKYQPRGALPELKYIYLVFFVAVALTGMGSAYYHLAPENSTLLWDRLPMSIAFMALFCCIIGENISVAAARQLVVPLIIAGMLSVLYWHRTEQAGQGDLRPYLLVQFVPVLVIPLILAIYPSKLTHNNYIWGLLVAYVLAKMAETLDAEIYSILGVISGHSLKHLLAAAGVYLFYLAINKRTRRGARTVA